MCRLVCLILLIIFAAHLAFAEKKIARLNLKVKEMAPVASRRTTRQTQADHCLSILNNIPSYCNGDALLTDSLIQLLNNTPHLLMDMHFDALNDIYKQICVPECVNPSVAFNKCVFAGFDDLIAFLERLERQGICGKNGNDFCEVVYLRFYQNNTAFIEELLESCTSAFGTAGVDCSSFLVTSTCRRLVDEFNTNMGCCAIPYLGDGISGCVTGSVEPACVAQVPSSAYTMAAPAFITMVLLAIFFMVF